MDTTNEHSIDALDADGSTIAVRAYPVILRTEQEQTDAPSTSWSPKHAEPGTWIEEWPRRALVFDCETRTDTSQRLTVGFAALIQSDWRIGRHELEGLLCFIDEAALSRPELLTVQDWLTEQLPFVLGRLQHIDQRIRVRPSLRIELVSVETFRERFYRLTAHRGRAAVVGFNLPFDLSRIASRTAPTKDKRGFTLTLIDKIDSRGRHSTKVRHPRIRIEPIDGRRALIRFTGMWPRYDGRFVDLKVLGDALTGKRLTLSSACETFRAGRKAAHDHDGRVTRELLDYALLDVLSTAELYVAMLIEHRKHPIAKAPNEIYSEATIGKAYLDSMGLRLPELAVNPSVSIPGADDVSPMCEEERRNRVMGWATSTYFGGRTECRVRNTLVPVDYLDFLSMYPTVNALQRLWLYLRAERIRVVEATEEVRAFLEHVTADDLFDPATWQHLPAIALVEPHGDVLPTRARYGDEQYAAYGIGVNPIPRSRPLWYTLADCVVSKLRTGRAPRIQRALRFIPEGQQRLQPAALRSQVAIDPNAEDFFRAAIVERRTVKKGQPPYDGLESAERDALQQFLKILVNATSYGIFMEMNRQAGQRALVRAHGLTTLEREIDGPEELGRFCFPPLATMITAAARLMLALAEHEVRSRGGCYAFMDTDSIAIVATESGDVIPCEGGELVLSDGRTATRALSRAEVAAIRARFSRLNPYGDAESILELEKENYGRCGLPDHSEDCTCTQELRQLVCFSTASKRYALANVDAERIDIRKYSEHGLGAFEAPDDPETGQRIRKWERELWTHLIARALGLEPELPPWAHQTALTQVRISTPEQLRWFARYNAERDGSPKPYEDSVKPFGFLSHAMPRPMTSLSDGGAARAVCLVAPAGERRHFIDRHAPAAGIYSVGLDFTPQTYADLIDVHHLHPERKFADARGRSCTALTSGLLDDRPVVVTRVKHVGKEGTELEAHRAGIVDETERQFEYHDSWLEDLAKTLQVIPTKVIAEATGYNERTVRRLKRGEFRPSAIYLQRLRTLLDRVSLGERASMYADGLAPSDTRVVATNTTASA